MIIFSIFIYTYSTYIYKSFFYIKGPETERSLFIIPGDDNDKDLVRRICKSIDLDIMECQEIFVPFGNELLQFHCTFHLHFDGKMLKVTTGVVYYIFQKKK